MAFVSDTITPASPPLINHRQVLIPPPNNLSIHHKNRNKPRDPLAASILPNGVVAPGHLHEALAHPVYPGWLPVHPAQYGTLRHARHDGRAGVPVGRREAPWWVGYLEADYGFPGGVGEGVVVEKFDCLAGAGAGCRVSILSVPSSVVLGDS